MKRLSSVVVFSIFCGMALPCLAADEPYVISNSGEKMTGTEIKADAAGNIELDTGKGVVSLRRGDYKRAYKPRPSEVVEIYQYFQKEEYDKVIKYSPQVMEKYKYLGWGDMIAYMQGMALVEKGDGKEALRVIRRGENYARSYEDLLMKAKALALEKTDEQKEAVELLDSLIKDGETETAAFAFNTKGRIKANAGQKKEAVLEYLKTLLLFKPSEAEEERKTAKKRAVALLREMNDPRAEKIAELD